MKLVDIVHPAFSEALLNLSKRPLPPKTAYKLAGIVTVVREELKKFNELRNKLIQQYAEKDDKGELKLEANKSVVFTAKNRDKFIADLEEMVSIKIKLESLKLEELGDTELTAADLIALGKLIKKD